MEKRLLKIMGSATSSRARQCRLHSHRKTWTLESETKSEGRITAILNMPDLHFSRLKTPPKSMVMAMMWVLDTACSLPARACSQRISWVKATEIFPSSTDVNNFNVSRLNSISGHNYPSSLRIFSRARKVTFNRIKCIEPHRQLFCPALTISIMVRPESSAPLTPRLPQRATFAKSTVEPTRRKFCIHTPPRLKSPSKAQRRPNASRPPLWVMSK